MSTGGPDPERELKENRWITDSEWDSSDEEDEVNHFLWDDPSEDEDEPKNGAARVDELRRIARRAEQAQP
jgi:hypothetical protein